MTKKEFIEANKALEGCDWELVLTYTNLTHDELQDLNPNARATVIWVVRDTLKEQCKNYIREVMR